MTKEEYQYLDKVMGADENLFQKMIEETKRINESETPNAITPLDISHEEFMARYHLVSIDDAFKELDDIVNGKSK